MSEPVVSVVVLGYNGRRYVDDCLRSVCDQDFDRPYEVLFVDNASRDDSAELAGRVPGVQVHRLPRNGGYCGGNNAGFALASAPMVVFLNQDTVVHRAWLRELVRAAESDAAVKAVHANVVHPWNPGYADKDRARLPEVAYAPDLSRLGFVEYRSVPIESDIVDTLSVSGVSVLVRRDVVEQVGGYVFDPDMFAYGEDVDLALRLRGAGYRVVLATRAVVFHDHTLERGLNLASFLKTVRIIRNRLLAFWKNAGWPEFLVLALVMLAGSPFNSGQFGLGRTRSALYSLLLVPPTLVAAAAAVVAMPKYASRRRQALQARKLPSGWVLRAMLSRSDARVMPSRGAASAIS